MRVIIRFIGKHGKTAFRFSDRHSVVFIFVEDGSSLTIKEQEEKEEKNLSEKIYKEILAEKEDVINNIIKKLC